MLTATPSNVAAACADFGLGRDSARRAILVFLHAGLSKGLEGTTTYLTVR
jgi:hypothetical protein